MAEHIHFERRGHIALVTIDRPAVRNALNVRAAAEMRAAILRLAESLGR